MKTEHSIENIQPNQAEIKELKDLEREAADYIAKEFHGSLSAEALEKMRGLPSEFKSNEEVAKAYASVPDMNDSKPHTQLQREVDRLVTQEMSNRAQNEANVSLKEIETDIKSGKSNRVEMTEEATSRELQKDIDAQEKDVNSGKSNRLEMTKEATLLELQKDLDAQKKNEWSAS